MYSSIFIILEFPNSDERKNDAVAMLVASRPVFLFFCADRGKNLAMVKKELEEIKLTLVDKFGQEVECQVIVATTLDELHRNFLAYRKYIVLFHFAGHSEEGNLVLEDAACSPEGLAAQMSEAPQLRMVFLNACHTWKLTNALQAAGVKNILATHEGVADGRAFGFARKFYNSLASGISFWKAYALAIEWAKDEYKATKSVHRGPVSGEATQLKWDFWNKDEGKLNLTIPQLVSEVAEGIRDTEPNQLFDPDTIICRLNRHPQDKALTGAGLKKQSVLPLILYGEDIHEPRLYIRKLTEYFEFHGIEYDFPTSPGRQDLIEKDITRDIASRPHLLKGAQYRGMVSETELSAIFSLIEAERVLLYSIIDPDIKPAVLEQHHRFWHNQQLVADKTVVSILVVTNVNQVKTGWWFWPKGISFENTKRVIESWCAGEGEGRYHLPALDYIKRNDRDSWENEEITRLSPLNNLFFSEEYRKEIRSHNKPVALRPVREVLIKLWRQQNEKSV